MSDTTVLYPYAVYTVKDAEFYMEHYNAPTFCDADSQYASPMGTERD